MFAKFCEQKFVVWVRMNKLIAQTGSYFVPSPILLNINPFKFNCSRPFLSRIQVLSSSVPHLYSADP